MKAWLLLLVLATVGVAMAQSVSAVAKLIDEGEFQEAYTVASRNKTADFLILAAKGASFHAYYTARNNEKLQWYERAADAARQAIKADSKNPGGYFELARALGRQSQFKGILQALAEGLAPQIRDNLNRVLQLDPRNADARISLALWHFEITQKGVGWLCGADANRVEPLLKEGLALDPDNIIFKVEYADMLVRSGRKEDARRMLEQTLTHAPKTVPDRLDLDRARKMLSDLR